MKSEIIYNDLKEVFKRNKKFIPGKELEVLSDYGYKTISAVSIKMQKEGGTIINSVKHGYYDIENAKKGTTEYGIVISELQRMKAHALTEITRYNKLIDIIEKNNSSKLPLSKCKIYEDEMSAKVFHPKDVYEITKEIHEDEKENLMLLCLDEKGRVIKKEILITGSEDEITIHPREVYNAALKHLCSNIILVHNHPSGDTKPSPADLEATKRLIEISKIIGIKLVDHIIVSKHNYHSIRENSGIKF